MPHPHPIIEKERILSLDVLRGFALLGILPMNIQFFSMIGAAYFNPTAYGDLHGANYAVWLLSHVLVDLKFMTIFCMLFGAGIVLMTSRLEAAGRQPAVLHYRRMGWLILFGLLHAYFLWVGDILYDYGMCGLFVYLFRQAPPKRLLVAGLLLMSATPAMLIGTGRAAAHWPPEQVQRLSQGIWESTPQATAEELAAYRGDWLTQTRTRVPEAIGLQTVYFMYWGFWRESGVMLIGMALFKMGVFSGKLPASAYWKMIAIAVCIGIPVTLYGAMRNFAAGWDFRYGFFFGQLFNYFASPLVSLGWVGAVMLAWKTAVLRPFMQRLAAVGRMAFSNYILDTVICTTIFYGHGFGLFGKVERVWQFAIVIAIWALQLAISPIWLKFFLFGPLEWLWRSLTYWRREPMLRT